MPPRRFPIPPKLTSEWSRGPRILAWDAFWERILTDVLNPQTRVTDDAVKESRNAG